MQADGIPSMESLAPLVDRMRELAQDELPAPRSGMIRLRDDGTFDVVIYHYMGDEERQMLRYERMTGEILWEYVQGVDWEAHSFSGNETLSEPTYEVSEIRVLDTVEPPCSEGV